MYRYTLSLMSRSSRWYRSLLTLLFIFLALIIMPASNESTTTTQASPPLETSNASLRVKTAKINGNLGFKIAEYSYDLNEDMYFHFPVPCAAGLCHAQFQESSGIKDSCDYMGCDFTLKGDQCGKARIA